MPAFELSAGSFPGFLRIRGFGVMATLAVQAPMFTGKGKSRTGMIEFPVAVQARGTYGFVFDGFFNLNRTGDRD